MKLIRPFLISCIGLLLLAMKLPVAGKPIGNWQDDYGITYRISDTLWTQEPGIRYHVIHWNEKDQYILAKNDADNPTDAGLYTRIDYRMFADMKPWTWGFCLTVYNAQTDSLALAAQAADREHPKKGCNGFPFSRMKPIGSNSAHF